MYILKLTRPEENVKKERQHFQTELQHVERLNLKHMTTIQDAEKTIADLEGELRDTIKEKDKIIKDLEEEINDRDGTIDELDQIQADHEERITELKGIEKQITALKQDLSDKRYRLGNDISFTKKFQSDVESCWTDRHKPRYKRVKALLVRWSSDDLGVSREINQLRTYFTGRNFHVSKFIIPDRQWSSALQAR
jgi:chromosome segregation ATPase